MILDGNPKEKAAMDAFLRGDSSEGARLQDEFVEDFREYIKTNDYCPCSVKCKFRGKCVECVAMHRAHRHHVPACLSAMVSEKSSAVSDLAYHK